MQTARLYRDMPEHSAQGEQPHTRLTPGLADISSCSVLLAESHSCNGEQPWFPETWHLHTDSLHSSTLRARIIVRAAKA